MATSGLVNAFCKPESVSVAIARDKRLWEAAITTDTGWGGKRTVHFGIPLDVRLDRRVTCGYEHLAAWEGKRTVTLFSQRDIAVIWRKAVSFQARPWDPVCEVCMREKKRPNWLKAAGVSFKTGDALCVKHAACEAVGQVREIIARNDRGGGVWAMAVPPLRDILAPCAPYDGDVDEWDRHCDGPVVCRMLLDIGWPGGTAYGDVGHYVPPGSLYWTMRTDWESKTPALCCECHRVVTGCKVNCDGKPICKDCRDW